MSTRIFSREGMDRYLIDIRLMGSVKNQIERLSSRLQEKFGIHSGLTIPHITLAGPFSTDEEEKLVADFARVCKDQQAAPEYVAEGIGFFDRTRVVYVTVTPDENLKRFRYELAQALLPYCTLRDYDRASANDFRFHATLAMKLDLLTYTRIQLHFRKQERVVHRPHPVRATLLKNSEVLCEYDFARGRMLTPAQARGRALRVRDYRVIRPYDHEGRDP
jgi:2'-5' RNA ligase